MSLFYPRFVVNEFTPMFRLLNDVQTVSRPHHGPHGRCGRPSQLSQLKLRSFQPRFDVTETKEGYELKGELPGVEQGNVEIVVKDEKTLVVRGSTESVREEGERPEATATATQAEGQSEEVKATEEPVPVSSDSETGSYHQPSVEDEEYVDVASESAAQTTTTPAETPKEEPATATAAPAKTEQRSRTWVSERSVGKFQRVFQFPRRLDQENVTATLKDGVLSIVVPKAAVPESKRVEIQ